MNFNNQGWMNHMQQALAWKLQISPQSRQEHIKPLMLIAGQLGVSGPPEKTIESVKGFENACFERAQSWAEYQAMIATKMNEIRQKLGQRNSIGMQATGFMNMQTPVISNTMGLGGAMNLNSSLAQFTQMQGLQGQMLNNSLQQQVMYQGMQVPQPMNLGLAITPNSNPQIQVPTQTQNMAQTIQLSQLQKQDIQTQLHAFGPTLQKIDVLFAGLQGDNKEGVELFMQRKKILQDQYIGARTGLYFMSPEQCKHLIGVLQKAVNALENKNMQDVQEQPAAIAERIAQPPAVEELVVPPHIKSLIDADFNTSSNNPLKYLKGTFTSPRRRFLPPTVNIATNDASANDAFEIIGGHVRVSVGESLLDRFTSQRSAGTLENDMDLLNEKYPNATTFSFDCKMSVLLNNSDATGIRVDTRGYPFKACVSLENSTDRYDSIAAFINAS